MQPQQYIREELCKKVAASRSNLLTVVIFTVVNIALLLLNTGTYFLFSASGPYYLTAFGIGMDRGMAELGREGHLFTILALVISAALLGMLLLSWAMSKKQGGWLIFGLVVMVLDTLILLGITLMNTEFLANSIIDFVFHAWVLYILFSGIRANKALKELPEEVPSPIDSMFQTESVGF